MKRIARKIKLAQVALDSELPSVKSAFKSLARELSGPFATESAKSDIDDNLPDHGEFQNGGMPQTVTQQLYKLMQDINKAPKAIADCPEAVGLRQKIFFLLSDD